MPAPDRPFRYGLGRPEIHPLVRQHTVSTRIGAYDPGQESGFIGERIMKWVGTYLVGFVIVIGAVLAALWKLGVLQNIETMWIVIGVAALVGLGIMISVANSGVKENIQIERK